MEIWNPWHGCHKISEGCLNCYMFRRDAMYDKDSNIVTKTSTFNAPVKRSRDGKKQTNGAKRLGLLSASATTSVSALSQSG